MSTITLINNTAELVRLAVFKQPLVNPNLSTIAWRIAAPPPNGGMQTLQVPSNYQVFARYSNDPGNPSSLNCQTQTLSFDETTALFDINEVVSSDRRAIGASLTQRFDGLVVNEVRVNNNYALGAEVSITLDGAAIYPPQTLWPNGLFMEDVRSTLYVAVISQPTFEGDRLVQEEISQTQMPVLLGGKIQISGSVWTGYTLSRA